MFGVMVTCPVTVPEMPPDNVRVVPLNSTAVKIWWKPPNPQHVNGINQGYKLQAWQGEFESNRTFRKLMISFRLLTITVL